ncbi:hypothetical protein PCI56_17840 [Plesiomonas shigelloides subsp. oncorhynchi]|nr:hypothetical protein [Plesiomonas shigelloides]
MGGRDPAEQVTQFIQQDVTSFAKAQKSQQFDVKLRNMPDFPECATPPQIQRLSEDPPAGRVSYEVRCSAPKPGVCMSKPMFRSCCR